MYAKKQQDNIFKVLKEHTFQIKIGYVARLLLKSGVKLKEESQAYLEKQFTPYRLFLNYKSINNTDGEWRHGIQETILSSENDKRTY